jgi:hypothetical protein
MFAGNPGCIAKVARASASGGWSSLQLKSARVTGCGKIQNAVILSEVKNLSLFVLLYLNQRGILRFAQNNRTSHFFRGLFSPRYCIDPQSTESCK